MVPIKKHADEVLEFIRGFPDCAVAFSGGVDSAVVAQAAFQVLGDSSIAVTAISPSLPSGELAAAKQLASAIGIRHHVLETYEYDDPRYRRNETDRCYFCKSELYKRMHEIIDQFGVSVVFNGTNKDDLGDYRPGLKAASENRVRSPLAECNINKQQVREIAKMWNLTVWDKPAGPCLSSRIAYGEEVSTERLQMIDGAETWLRQQGFNVVRVRYHRGDLARVEVPLERIDELMHLREPLTLKLKEMGFRFVTIDLNGFQSGSLNVLVSIEGV